MSTLRYKRVLLKLSGQAFGDGKVTVDPRRINIIVNEIRALRRFGVEVAVVIGAGNIWRKRTHGQGIDGTTADYLGLIATLMNGLALYSALQKKRLPVRLQSPLAYDLPNVEKIDAVAARGSLRRGEIVIFGGGTGKPFFTTDTAAALRAKEIQAQIIIKAGPVNGVYLADPKKYKLAKKLKQLSLSQAIKLKLRVMDQEAYKICRQNNIAIVVCKWQAGVLAKVVKGEFVGSLIKP